MKRFINMLIVFLIIVLAGLITWQYLHSSGYFNKSEPTPTPDNTIITELMLTIGDPYAFFDGERVLIDPDNSNIMPVIVDDRTMLPLRFIAESFKMKIDWNESTKTVSLTTGDDFGIILTIGDTSAIVSGMNVTLDSPPVIIEDRTFLPLRFIAEQMKCDVDFNDATQDITITYNNVPLTPEELEQKKLLIQDRTNASILAKAAAKLCAYDRKYHDSISFSEEVIIDIELIRPYLPDPTVDFSVINTGTAPWMVSTTNDEFKVTDSSPERKVYFQGVWLNITPVPALTAVPTPMPSGIKPSPTPKPTPTPTPVPTPTPLFH